jgi:hypothetical protein
MKDEYFGDISDYRKYGLVRCLALPDRLPLGVCWMLTHEAGGGDGDKVGYLAEPQRYRARDPELYDWLRQVVVVEGDRRAARMEQSGLLGQATYQSQVLTDDAGARTAYFRRCAALFGSCDLVLFDPDNGLEVKSVPRGAKGSHRYLYWREVSDAYGWGASLLIFQYWPRVKRAPFTERLVDELGAHTGATAVFSFHTPLVLFLLAAQPRHADAFRRQLPAIQERWGPRQIDAREHPAS